MICIQVAPDEPSDGWVDVNESKEPICVTRWRNAGPEQRKQMFAVFQESGIFVACCRHRFVLVGCDMIKSGELFVSTPCANAFGIPLTLISG